jgi:hypothetical protein
VRIGTNGRPVRIVFDTNALSNESFELLEAGPMRDLCRRGRIIAIYGHVFLEETLRTYGKKSRRDELIARRLPFVADTAALIGKDLLEIWQEEVVRARGPRANVYWSGAKKDRYVEKYKNPSSEALARAWSESDVHRSEDRRKTTAQVATLAGARSEAREALKQENFRASGAMRTISFDALLRVTNLVASGRRLIKRHARAKRLDAIADRWASAPDFYPFFSASIRNFIYMTYYATTKEAALDQNAQADLDIMTHLLRAHALVSNETRFLRTAFDDMWRPKGKILFTAAQFDAFIRRL